MFLKNESFYKIKEFEDLGLTAIQTTVNTGSLSPYFSEDGMKNLDNFLKEINLSHKKLLWAKQTHTNKVYDIKDGFLDSYEDIDGFVTNRSDIVIATFYADCLPIFAYDKKNKIIGLSHSGWTGSLKGIGIKMVEKMIESYESKKEDIIIAFGVGMSGACYEVSSDFIEAFRGKYSKNILEEAFFEKEGKYYFDNQLFNYLVLKEFGIKEIITNDECTFLNEKFYSHRRQGKLGGRSAAIFSMAGI